MINENTINAISEQLSLNTPAGKSALRLFLDAAVLLDSKNQDYGTGNISAFGERGVVVRLSDKIERLKTLVWQGKSPEHEKVEDSWLDVTNYGIIGLLCHRGDWK